MRTTETPRRATPSVRIFIAAVSVFLVVSFSGLSLGPLTSGGVPANSLPQLHAPGATSGARGVRAGECPVDSVTESSAESPAIGVSSTIQLDSWVVNASNASSVVNATVPVPAGGAIFVWITTGGTGSTTVALSDGENHYAPLVFGGIVNSRGIWFTYATNASAAPALVLTATVQGGAASYVGLQAVVLSGVGGCHRSADRHGDRDSEYTLWTLVACASGTSAPYRDWRDERGRLCNGYQPAFGLTDLDTADEIHQSSAVDLTVSESGESNISMVDTEAGSTSGGIDRFSMVAGAISPTSTTAYTVAFSESGLPTGTSWAIILGGSYVSASAPAEITLELPNGSYSYSPEVPGGSYAAPPGSVEVTGASTSVSAAFGPNSTGTTTGSAPVIP